MNNPIDVPANDMTEPPSPSEEREAAMRQGAKDALSERFFGNPLNAAVRERLEAHELATTMARSLARVEARGSALFSLSNTVEGSWYVGYCNMRAMLSECAADAPKVNLPMVEVFDDDTPGFFAIDGHDEASHAEAVAHRRGLRAGWRDTTTARA